MVSKMQLQGILSVAVRGEAIRLITHGRPNGLRSRSRLLRKCGPLYSGSVIVGALTLATIIGAAIVEAIIAAFG